MNPELERIEIQPVVLYDDNFTIQNTLLRQRRFQRRHQLGEIAIQRPFVTALNKDFIAVAKNNRPKAVPLGLEDPSFVWREDSNSFCEHRLNRWRNGQFHHLMVVE